MRYRTPLGGFAKWVSFRTDGPRQAGRDPDRLNRHYENIYIDAEATISPNSLRFFYRYYVFVRAFIYVPFEQ